MTANFNVKSLTAAVRLAKMIDPGNSKIAKQLNVSIVADQTGARIVAKNSLSAIVVEVGDSWGELSISVNGSELLDALKGWAEKRAGLSLVGDSLRITGDTSHVAIPLSGEFVTDLPEGREGYFFMPASDLVRGIERTVFATDQVSARYALSGIYLDWKDGHLDMVSTDGKRMSVVSADLEGEGEFAEILPYFAAKILQKGACKKGEVLIGWQLPYISILCEGFSLYTRAVEGRFPNWRYVIPNDLHDAIPLTGEVEEVAKRVIRKDSEGDRLAVKVEISSQGRFTMSTLDGKACAVYTSAHIQSDYKFGVDPLYLAEGCKAADGLFELHFSEDNSRPVMLTSPGYTYVLMPCNLPKEETQEVKETAAA